MMSQLSPHQDQCLRGPETTTVTGTLLGGIHPRIVQNREAVPERFLSLRAMFFRRVSSGR